MEGNKKNNNEKRNINLVLAFFKPEASLHNELIKVPIARIYNPIIGCEIIKKIIKTNDLSTLVKNPDLFSIPKLSDFALI